MDGYEHLDLDEIDFAPVEHDTERLRPDAGRDVCPAQSAAHCRRAARRAVVDGLAASMRPNGGNSWNSRRVMRHRSWTGFSGMASRRPISLWRWPCC
ncbi:DUF6417 family protein [Streptomyces sp. NPDC002755]|uniref:DUF6417 family protein n=1 Tax=Streptomyces sp. NPDC002884 TaxID=3154544 RepID=UPI0033194B6A